MSARSTLLAPLSRLYGAWIRRRNARYDRPGASARAALPVVSVGNLSVGGTGKTPVVGWLARNLLERGERPAIVSRGYRGSAGKGPLLVCSGAGPRCDAAAAGDEPWMLAQAVPQAIVVVGSDRRAGARAALDAGATLILLDDGFQHRSLARDLDIVLLDLTRPFDRDRLLPAGTLREPPASLARADWIVITRAASAARAQPLADAARAINPAARVVLADHRAAGFRDARGRAVETPRRAVAFCAIGNPARFRSDLAGCGVELLEFHALRDHATIDARRLRRWARSAAEAHATLVTTAKDAARIGTAVAGLPLAVLAIEPTLEQGERLLDAILSLRHGGTAKSG